MALSQMSDTPARSAYDVVIIGGAIMGSSAAWWLTEFGFDGSILVLERDPSYEKSATALTNSCIRQQFSTELNVRISQFTAEFLRGLRERMGGDDRVPEIGIQNFGYLYLADTDAKADALRIAQRIQRAAGAETRLLTRTDIAEAYPFYTLDDIVLGSINTRDEGYWDGGALFEFFRRSARSRGVDYVAAEVTGMTLDKGRVTGVTLAGGQTVACGQVVNASGTRAARTARMAGIELPVEPRKRFSWVFKAERPLDRTLPLTIDPSGVHVRQDGPQTYLAGCKPDTDTACDADDFAMDPDIWQDHVWPAIAARIPHFEAIRVIAEWAGHYDMNTLDQNAIVGPHPEVENFLFMNGFSGHGLQQSPAMGRGMAEWLIHGAFRSLDLSPFRYDRIPQNEPYLETAVI